MADALYHSSPEYQCSMMTPCTYTGKEIIERERLGREEDHLLWDRREEVRVVLKEVVTIMLDKDYAKDEMFLNSLLKNIVILETMEQCKEYDSQMICTALARKLSGNIRLILFIMILCCLGIHVKYSQGPQ